ncbi:MAG: class I tRNA ligase family protein, partial [Nanoarchaeota archaeon]
TINKLINVARFVTQFKKPSKVKQTYTDKVFLDYLNYEISQIEWHYDRYDFWKPAMALRNFLWEVFASHYIELVKSRAYNQENKFKKEESESAIWTLYTLLEKLITLFYPIIPQVTSVIGNELNINLHKAEFPEGIKNPGDSLAEVNAIISFNSEIWKAKKDEGLNLRDPLKNYIIDNNLRRFREDLIACHNLQ